MKVNRDVFRMMSDQKWLKLLIRAAGTNVVDDIELPTFPSRDVQAITVGSTGEQALKEAFVFYSYIKAFLAYEGQPLCPESRVLDFGCGWGRFLRFFMKDVDPDGLFGVDVDPDLIGFCRGSGIPAHFAVVPALGPSPYANNSFDLVYAYSVFSHLSEHAAGVWARELRRLLVPGGYLILTTERRWFINYAASLNDQEPEGLSVWHRALATAFANPEPALERYDAGEFVYAPTGGGEYRDSAFYGEAIIPRKYIEREWADVFEIVDWIDDETRFWQTVVALRAK